jgi:hypothetical protein
MKTTNIRPKFLSAKNRRPWLFLTTFLLSAYPVTADFIIHVQNPWRSVDERKDTLFMIGNSVVGFYPGTKMKNEGDGWFYFIYKTPLDGNSSHGFQIVSYIPTIFSATDARLQYPAAGMLNIDSLFAQFSPAPAEIWIYVDAPSKPAEVFDHPKNGTAIHFSNLWSVASPQIIFRGRGGMSDRVSVYSLTGRSLLKAEPGSGIGFSCFSPQPLLVRVSHNGKTVSTRMNMKP